MHLRAVLDDGQPQSRAADLLAAALVHAVEALEYALLILRRNTYAVVRDSHDGASVRHFCPRPDVSARVVVLDAVFQQVRQHLFQQGMVAGNQHRVISAGADAYLRILRGGRELLDAVLNQRGQIDGVTSPRTPSSRRDRRMMSSISVSRRRLSARIFRPNSVASSGFCSIPEDSSSA